LAYGSTSLLQERSPIFRAMNDDVLTWADVKRRLTSTPRGTQSKLAKALDIDSSDITRRLARGGELTARQKAVVEQVLSGDAGPLPEPRAIMSRGHRLPVFGYAAGDDGDLVLMNEGAIIDWLELPMGITLDRPDEYFVVRHTGPSMEPRFFPGAHHVVRRNYPPAYGRDCLIEFSNGHGAVKLYKGQRSGRVFGEQFNPPKTVDWDATGVKAIHTIAFTL
jgi:phage repressor protein C with HTH and peptisase S24 domain